MRSLALALLLLAAGSAGAVVPLPIHSVTGVGHVINASCPDAYSLVVSGFASIQDGSWGFTMVFVDNGVPVSCGLIAADDPGLGGAFDPQQGGCVASQDTTMCLVRPSPQPGVDALVTYDVLIVNGETVLYGVVQTVVT